MPLAATPKMMSSQTDGGVPPIPKPHPGSEVGSGSAGTYANPVHGSPPPDLGAPPQPSKSPDPDGTALLATEGINALVTLRYNFPLTNQEKAELQRDMAAVLAKYNVPDVPMMEEMRLGVNLFGIGMRRHAHDKHQQALRAAGGSRDSCGMRKEGEREEQSAAQAGGAGGFATPADILP